MERDFEYEAGRNQASRQWHMKKRKEAESECVKLRAEITQLRAELAAERELADRLYSAIEYIDDYCLAYPELEAVSAVSSSAIDYVDTRRNK